uniref:Uncharacterized protein n=1 Tax=Strongyloides papillosus TaxID=174720 RepID=A0A0N5B2Q2_STREA
MEPEGTTNSSQRGGQESSLNSSRNEDPSTKSNSLAVFFNSKKSSVREDSTKSPDRSTISNAEDTNSKSNLNNQESKPKLVNLYKDDPNSYSNNKAKPLNPFINSQDRDMENLLKLKDKEIRQWTIATVTLSFLSATLLGIILLMFFVF